MGTVVSYFFPFRDRNEAPKPERTNLVQPWPPQHPKQTHGVCAHHGGLAAEEFRFFFSGDYKGDDELVYHSKVRDPESFDLQCFVLFLFFFFSPAALCLFRLCSSILLLFLQN